MARFRDENEMLLLMKEKLYTPVVGDILDQMGYPHQFLPAEIRPLASQVPAAMLTDVKGVNWLKVAGFACTVLENDVYGVPKKPFGYMTEALDQLRPGEIYIATGAHHSALWGELLTASAKARGAAGAVLDLVLKNGVEALPDRSFPRDVPGTGGKVQLRKLHNPGFPMGALKEKPELVRCLPLAVTSALLLVSGTPENLRKKIPIATGRL